MLSNDSRPIAAEKFTTTATTIPARTPPIEAEIKPAAAIRPSASVEHPFLVKQAPQSGCEGVARERAERRQPDRHPERTPCRWRPRNKNARWNSMKPAEARRISIATHPSCRLGVVASWLAADGTSGSHHQLARQPERGEQRDREQGGCVRQGGGRPDRELQGGRRHHGDRPGEPGDQPELRVRLDEFAVGANDGRHERRLRDRVGLLKYERHEHQREQGDVVDEVDHQQLDDDPGGGDRLDDEATTPRGPGRSPGRSSAPPAGTARSWRAGSRAPWCVPRSGRRRRRTSRPVRRPSPPRRRSSQRG